jgi:hypothetical protein
MDRSLLNYNAMPPSQGDGMVVTLASVFTKTKEGVRGFISQAVSAEVDATFDAKLGVTFNIVENAMVTAVADAHSGPGRVGPMDSFYTSLADVGTGGTFDKHDLGFTTRIVSNLVANPSLRAFFGPDTPEYEIKKDPKFGFMGVVQIQKFNTTHASTKVVTTHPRRKLKIVSSIAIKHPNIETSPCNNMNDTAALLAAINEHELVFNFVNEHGVYNKVGRGKKPAFPFLAFDASQREETYDDEEKRLFGKREAVLQGVEDEILEDDEKKLKRKKGDVQKRLEELHARKKNRAPLKDRTNNKDPASDEDEEEEEDNVPAVAASAPPVGGDRSSSGAAAAATVAATAATAAGAAATAASAAVAGAGAGAGTN